MHGTLATKHRIIRFFHNLGVYSQRIVLSLQNQTIASNTNYNGGGNDPSPPRPSPPKERPDETTKLNGTNDEVEVAF